MAEEVGRQSSLRYYFVDEAGDPMLFNRRKEVVVGGEGCSNYFILGLLRTLKGVGSLFVWLGSDSPTKKAGDIGLQPAAWREADFRPPAIWEDTRPTKRSQPILGRQAAKRDRRAIGKRNRLSPLLRPR
jgi:hypothetical protein